MTFREQRVSHANKEFQYVSIYPKYRGSASPSLIFSLKGPFKSVSPCEMESKEFDRKP